MDTLSNKADVSCKRMSDRVNRGRAAGKNIFSQRSEPTSYSQIGVQSQSSLSAFRLFIDEPIQQKKEATFKRSLKTNLNYRAIFNTV